MAVIGNINGIPLFTTVQEALVWGQANGLSGYHMHTLQGVTGYMGGSTHSQARNPAPASNPTQTPQSSRLTARTPNVNRSSGGGGGGY